MNCCILTTRIVRTNNNTKLKRTVPNRYCPFFIVLSLDIINSKLYEFPHGKSDIRRIFIIKISKTFGVVRVDFIVYQIGYWWGSGYQSITDQCNADIVADNVIGGGELVNLQLNFGGKACLLTERIQLDTGIVAVAQGNEGVILKRFHGDAWSKRVNMLFA